MKKIIILIFMTIMLAACKENLSNAYLMEHPAILKHEIANCQVTDEKSNEQAARCEIVMMAAANLMSIVDEQQSDPEKFGQRVIDAEIACIKAKDVLTLAQQALDLQVRQHATTDELKAAQEKLASARKTYHEQHKEVKILLAVLSMGSPE